MHKSASPVGATLSQEHIWAGSGHSLRLARRAAMGQSRLHDDYGENISTCFIRFKYDAKLGWAR